MSRAKEMLDTPMSFEEYLQDILENIDDVKIQGIVKLAIDKGFNKLSEKQQFSLKNGVADYIMEECPNCETHIDYEDMGIAISNGRCSNCENDWNKNYVD